MPKVLKIIIVDDDHDVAESLADILEFDGHQVELAYSGADALRAVEKQGFDIGFMDVVMPGMDGVECLHKMQEIRPGAKIFMMTGYSVEALLNRAIDEGALGVLYKPFPAAKVREILKDTG